MIWLSRIIQWLPLAVAGFVLIWLFCLNLKKGEITEKTARGFLIIILIVYFLQLAGIVCLVYFGMKNNPVGQYLLPGKGTSYFYWFTWETIQPFFWSLIISLGVILILFLGKLLLKSSIVNRSDIFVIILACVVVGPSSIMVLFLGSFLLMIVFQLIVSWQRKLKSNQLRVKIAPFLLIVAFAILILKNFDFYHDFLSFLRLT